MLLTLVSMALPLVLLVRRPWVPRLFQVVLVLGALEWVRMAVILGMVAALTASSALVFRSRAVKERYELKRS